MLLFCLQSVKIPKEGYCIDMKQDGIMNPGTSTVAKKALFAVYFISEFIFTCFIFNKYIIFFNLIADIANRPIKR